MPIVSVIMPVYGVEKYLEKALDSVLDQTLTDLEVLAVDDGSPDNCGAILDRYAAADPRVKAIHQENGGAPSARNHALDQATGKYVMFMDPDDWTEPTMLQDMVKVAERDQAELVISGFYIDTYYDADKMVVSHYRYKDVTYPDAAAFHKDAWQLFDRNQLYSPWNKLFLRAYIEEHQLRFPQTFWDDFPFVLSVIRDVQRVSVMKKQYYHFLRARSESETARYRANAYEKREEEHEWMLELYKHWNYMDSATREMIARRYVERLLGCVEALCEKNCPLSHRERLLETNRMIHGRHVAEEMSLAKPGLTMRIFLWPIKKGRVRMSYFMCSIVAFVKQHSTKLFAIIKTNR